VAIIAGVVGYGFGGRRSGQGRHQTSADRSGSSTSEPDQTEEVDRLRSQVADLERKLGVLTAHVATQKPNGAGPEEVPPETTKEPVTPAEQVERDRVAWENHIAAGDAAFKAEPGGPGWAGSATDLLRARSVSEKVIRAAVKQIDCRSTTCRVEMVDDQKGEFARRLPVFLQGVSNVFPMGQARTVDNADGTKTLSVYLSTVADPPGPGSPGG